MEARRSLDGNLICIDRQSRPTGGALYEMSA
jgi:hypothetical protein